MELTLLGSAGLAAFLIGGGAVLVFVAFRRTIELRGALIQAMRRIERLEQIIANGAPIAANSETADPTAAPAPHRLLDPVGDASFTAAASDALEADRIAPPPLWLVCTLAIVATLGALIAGALQGVSAQGGVDIAVVAGALVIVFAEWRWRWGRSAEPANAGGPPSACGLATLIGLALMTAAFLCGWGVFHSTPPFWAMSALGAIALVAIGFALRYGMLLALFGLATGAAAPALVAFNEQAPPFRYVLLAALLALAMFVARRRNATPWLAALIAFAWGANGAAWGGDAAHVSAVAAYFAVLAALGLLSAWDAAGVAPFPAFWRGTLGPTRRAGLAVTTAASAGLVLTAVAHPMPATAAGPGFVALALITVGALAGRPGLWLASFAALSAAAAAIGFWAGPPGGVPDAPGLVILAAVLALVFSLGGAGAMAGAKDPRPGATLAALAPVALFVAAHEHIGGFGAPEHWAAAALAIAAINALIYLQTLRSRSAAAAPFAMGAAIALAGGLYAATPAPFAPLALAAFLPALALIERWRDEPGLRVAGIALCALLLARLVAPEIFVVTASSPPLLTLLFLVALFAGLVASLIFTRHSNASEISLAFALTLGAIFATLLARHLFTAGQIGAPYASLAETGVNALVWIGLAVLLAWRFGPAPRPALFAAELIVIAIAAIHSIIAGALVLNPWQGLAPADPGAWGGFSLIQFAYGLPALLLLLYAQVRRRQGMIVRAGAAEALALALLLATLMLELRRLFHGAAMASAPVSAAEAWAYSLAALGFAALLLALALLREGRVVRFAALALAIIALGKMALFDLGAFTGAPRFVGFLALTGLIALIIGLAYRGFFVRLLRAAARPKTLTGKTLPDPVSEA